MDRLLSATAVTRSLILVGLVVLYGCASVPKEDKLLEERTGLHVSAAQLRVQVRTLARPFGGVIEGAADRALSEARTPEDRVRALRFKINGIPAVHGALFEADPVAALFETAALLDQMLLFVEEGPGSILSVQVRAQVVAAVEDMKARLHRLGAALGVSPEDEARFWAKAEAWAREHPVTDSFAARETTQALFAKYLVSAQPGIRAMARRLDESVLDITLRFDLYAEYLAKQARWQAELMVEEALLRGVPRRVLEEAGPLRAELTALPFDIAGERTRWAEVVAAERALVLEWAHGERLETLDFIRAERKAVADVVASERQLVLDAIQGERRALLAEVGAQRVAAIADLEGVIARSLTASRREVVDHAVLRLAQLMAVGIAVAFLGALVLIWYARRPRSASGEA